MIVACTSCSVRYSVPDAKIRGKKVRITCRHCAAAFIVDATDEPIGASMKLDAPTVVPTLPTPFRADVGDDATRVIAKPNDFSVHDEPTVIGQIPEAALAAERRFSQSTLPPPAEKAGSGPPLAVPGEQVAESPRTTTRLSDGPHPVPRRTQRLAFWLVAGALALLVVRLIVRSLR